MYFYEDVARIFRIEQAGSARYDNALDGLLTGRVETYETAILLIGDKPWAGWGFDRFDDIAAWGGIFVHNEWLKYAYQSGVFFMLMAALLLAFLGSTCRKIDTASAARGLPAVHVAVLITAIAQTMVEYTVFTGAFQKSAALWVIMGGALTVASRRSAVGFDLKTGQSPATETSLNSSLQPRLPHSARLEPGKY